MRENVIKVSKKGAPLLHNPLLNKGTAFTQEERDLLGLNGLLPPHISTIEEQIKRSYLNVHQKRTPLEKYECLVGLMSRNELLFYQLISRYPAEMLPIIYTPTVGEAAMQYSRIYFHQRGLYLSYPLKEQMEEIIARYPADEVDVIVVTDGERILGLGDQGIGGMTIPVGKLSLYTIFGGIHPARTLPVILDVGTHNPDFLKDDLYLGWRHTRLAGPEYYRFVDRFIQAIRKKYPKVLLQWEDFGKTNARPLLDKYRRQLLCFNDDIQGTAAVALAGLIAAVQMIRERLKDQRVVVLGGGSAGIGISDMIVTAMVDEGLSEAQARSRIYIVDIDGLIDFNTQHVSEAQKPYAKSQSELKEWKVHSHQIALFDVIANAHPTILIGVCAQGGAFTRQMIEEMAQHVKRPIIFPLSNPTSKAESIPDEVIQWTEGRAIMATGSPFHPVEYRGKQIQIGQCNNVYIFPGVGLGVLAVQSKQVTDEMFLEAARTLAQFSPALKDPNASLFPPIEEVRSISRSIAVAVARRACLQKMAACPLDEIENCIEAHIWEPRYPRYIYEE